MKLRGHLPITGDEIEVDLLVIPNIIAGLAHLLAPHWELAWKFRALWRYLLWHLGG